MKATELRIGNYIKRLDDSIFEVNSEDIQMIDKWDSSSFLLPKPIPLTEEWFKKFGFYKDDEYWSKDINDYKYCFKYRDWAKNWAFYQEFTDSPNSHDNGVKYPVSFDIEFVHQLQNLWFSLQHEELKIKE